MKQRPWLALLLWLLVPALAAVLPWAWRRSHPPLRPPERVLPPLTLTGEARRDRAAILERAARRLLPAGGSSPYPSEGPVERAALMGEIGLELLPLDATQAKNVMHQAIDMATRPADRVTRDDLDAPKHTRIGLLVRLAHSLRPYPELAERALRTAYEEAEGNRDPATQVYALCLFAREAADIDPARARSAVQKARGVLFSIPVSAAADPFAAAAAAVARLHGRAAARALVERALVAIPSTPARPLVEARLAARLAGAAPDRARELARQALANVGGQVHGSADLPVGVAGNPPTLRMPGDADRKVSATAHRDRDPDHRTPHTEHLNTRQLHDVAVILALTHPEVAQAAVKRISDPAERAAALIEMGGAVEARAPARAEAFFRWALRQAAAIPNRQARAALIVDAARGLAAYDLATAREAVLALPGPVPLVDIMLLGVRAVKREPAAARRLIEKTRDGDPANAGRIEGSYEISLAQVMAEPDLRRALAMAQQGRNPELQAAALLAVARRLESVRSPSPRN